MRQLLKRLFGRERVGPATPPEATPAHASASSDPVTTAQPAPVPASVLPAENVGLKDLVLGGWFVPGSGELYRGVPVLATDTVLDVGCGEGGYVRFCANQGARVICVDVDAQKIADLEQQLRQSPARAVECYVSDCAPIPVADGEASFVICTEVLEHVPDPAALMREIARVAQPGARFLLSVPDPASETLMKAVAPPFYFEHPNHIRMIGREEFLGLARDAGLVVERHEFIGAYSTVLWMALFVTGDPSYTEPRHPMLQHWMRTWSEIMAHPEGWRIKQALDQAIPKSQLIVARKPVL